MLHSIGLIFYLSLLFHLTRSKEHPPSFTDKLSTSPSDSIGVVSEGNTVTFHCKADGSSLYTYSYISTDLNGVSRDLTLDARYKIYPDGKLIITNAHHAKDDGYYFCVAKNSFGVALSKRAKLRIAYLTVPVTSGPVGKTATQYSGFKYTFSLTDSFPGYPTTSYIYTHNGLSLLENERISVSDAGNLYIANVQINDLGKYKSVVKNSVTLTQYTRPELSIQLQHAYPPGTVLSTILLGPSDKIAIHNKQQSVTFECFATGLPMPTITWKKNNQVISPSSKYEIKDYNKRLTVKSILSSDQATYSCHVSNPKSAGAGTRTANLVVHVEPTWSKKPANATAKVLNSVTFSCLATGSPMPKYTWYHNGEKVIPGKSARKSINANNNDLTIGSIVDSDRGVVQCVAANDAGYLIGTARLTVDGVPVWIDEPPSDRTALLGETIELTCKARGSVTPTINWQKDGNYIGFHVSGSRFHLKLSGSLQITNVQRSDSGLYTCIATTPSGYKNASATLKVLSQTNITKLLPSTMTAIKGFSATLDVGITHDKQVAVTILWTKDGSIIVDQRITILANGSLFISRVQDSDAGMYKCSVYSQLGNGTTSGRLVVQETPLSPSRPVVVSIQSESVRLTWDPPGYNGNSPIISYNVEKQKESESWTVALQNINPSSKVSAVVTGLKPNTRYKFRVRAVNSVGVGIPSDATAFITTYAAPPSQAPTNVIGTPASAESILVQWKIPPPASHNGALTGFRIAYRQSGIQSSSFNIFQVTNGLATQGTVTGLLRWTEYTIKVQAYNSAGSGPFSSQVLVMTGEGAPGAPVQNLKIININPSSVELQWEPPPQKQWNGNLKYYTLRAWEPSTPNTVTEQSINHDSSKSLQTGTLANLKKYTQYELVVLPVNGAGAGPQSTKLLVKTDQGIPDAVSFMTISEVYSDGFRVSWSRPAQINGQLVAYVIETWQNGSKAATLSTHRTPHDTLAYVTTGLKPRTVYFVTVAAETQAGKGSAKVLSVKTVDSPVAPSAPSKPEIVEARAWEVLIRWTPGFSGRAPIIQYKIEYNNDSFYDPVTAHWKLGVRVADAHRVYQLFPVKVPGMRPNVGYRFRVIATNVVGSSVPSNVSDKVMTLETAPSLPPSDVTVHSRPNAGEIELRWKRPPAESWNSDSIGYLLEFTPLSSPQHTHSTKIPNPYVNHYIVGGLLMYTKYRISLRCYNVNGKGTSNTSAEVTYTTSEGAPVTPPTNVKTRVVSATAIELTWGPVSEVGRNGKILGYQIFYRVAGQAIETLARVEDGSKYAYVLSDLESFVVYEFEILAYTRYGVGPKCSTVRARTFESVPGPPSQVRFSYIEKDSVKMLWNPPIYPHGNITRYRVAYRRNHSSGYYLYDSYLSATRRAEVFVGLHKHTYYRFFLWAETKKGLGPSAQQVVFTTDEKGFPPDTPFIFPIPTEAIRERSVEIEWRINEYPLSPYRYFTLQFQVDSGGWQYYSRNLNHKLRKLKVEGLLPGTKYSFQIKATNDLGDSPYSKPSQEVTTNPTVPTGSPRDLRIRAETSSSLLVEWTAPNPEEIGGTLQGFIIKYRKKGNGYFSQLPKLGASVRRYSITGLDVFTLYYIVIAVVNEKGTGRFTPELPGTTGELAPGKGPTKVEPGTVGKTSLLVKWQAPPLSSINGYLQGFKVFFKGELPSRRRRRRRRRRRSIEDCELSDSPSFVEVEHDKTEVTIRNLRKHVTYSIWVRAYNSKGVSPSSEVIKVTTASDIPGPLQSFGADLVFNDRVNLSWKKPCHPNGKPEAYEITYYKTTSSIKSKVTVQPDKTSYVITDLDMLTEYMFEIRFKNNVDYGPSLSFITMTKGPAVLPGRPGKPSVRASSTTAILSWRNGHSGNVPFLKFEIQSRIPGQGEFKTEWTILPSELKQNKSFVSCTVGNLKPQTSYQFRIIAWNKVGKSEPSPPSDISMTSYGVLPPPQPLHEETWFIAVTAVLAVILAIVVIGIIFICMRRRKESIGDRLSTTGSSNRNTLELKDQRQTTGSNTGSIPGLHIAYRDPNEEIAEVSSLGSKDGMSDVDGASGGENYLDKDPNKLKFVDHYAHDPKHESWRTTFDNQDDAAKAKYEEYTSQVVALPDDFQKPRFKSFSSLEGKDFPVPPPPAYESHPEDDVDPCYAELPTEAVTSFMSPEYEAKKTRSLGRPRSAMRHVPSDSDEDLDRKPRRGYGSQSQIDQYSPRKSRDDLRQPHRGSREHFDAAYHRKPRMDGYSYSTMPHPRHLKQNQIYQNLSHSPSGHEADVSSEMSSSSNGDHRTPGRYPVRGPKPLRYPKPEFPPKDPGRRRNRPSNLAMPPSKYPDHSTSSDSPTSPISPAPSYHSNDEYNPSRSRTSLSRIPPPMEYADARDPEAEPVYQNTLPRRIEPRVIVRHGRSNEHIEADNEVHISPYQSFV